MPQTGHSHQQAAVFAKRIGRKNGSMMRRIVGRFQRDIPIKKVCFLLYKSPQL